MKVAEFVKLLLTCPQDAEVYIGDCHECYGSPFPAETLLDPTGFTRGELAVCVEAGSGLHWHEDQTRPAVVLAEVTS